MTTWSQWQQNIYSTLGIYEATASLKAQRVRLLSQYVENPERQKCSLKILDLGCGDGAVTEKLREMGHKALGVDFQKVIKIAHEKYPQNHFVSADLSGKFPFKSGGFDLIYASHILAHIPDDIQFLKECHRVLKPKGVLILATPNRFSLQQRTFYLLGFQQYNPATTRDTQVHIYSFQSLRKLLQYCGFQPKILRGLTPLGEKVFWRKIFCVLERALPKTFRTEIWALAQKI